MDLSALMTQWRAGLLSDVEALIMLLVDLPPSAATDSVIEIVGKMNDEEKEEWEGRAEAFAQMKDLDI